MYKLNDTGADEATGWADGFDESYVPVYSSGNDNLSTSDSFTVPNPAPSGAVENNSTSRLLELKIIRAFAISDSPWDFTQPGLVKLSKNTIFKHYGDNVQIYFLLYDDITKNMTQKQYAELIDVESDKFMRITGKKVGMILSKKTLERSYGKAAVKVFESIIKTPIDNAAPDELVTRFNELRKTMIPMIEEEIIRRQTPSFQTAETDETDENDAEIVGILSRRLISLKHSPGLSPTSTVNTPDSRAMFKLSEKKMAETRGRLISKIATLSV
jgi:hypothetical protein